MEIFAYLFAALIGVSLGLIGAGGSILTVPVLVYLAGVDPVLATAYSLFVVGSTALAGGLQNLRRGCVDLKTAVIFGIPSIVAVYLARAYIMPAIPAEIWQTSGLVLTKDTALLLFFAGLMVITSLSMIRDRKPAAAGEEAGRLEGGFRYPLIVIEGAGVGVLTGLVGAGGGFLIIPALVLLAGLEMKKAVGTSLFIIAAKSLIGFTGDLQAGYDINWTFLLVFTLFSMSGIFLGGRLGRFIDGARLKKGFGWFVLAMGIYMIFKETVF